MDLAIRPIRSVSRSEPLVGFSGIHAPFRLESQESLGVLAGPKRETEPTVVAVSEPSPGPILIHIPDESSMGSTTARSETQHPSSAN